MIKDMLRELLGLRPKAETIEEVSAALARTTAANDEAQRRAEQLLAQRADVLLSGSEAEIGRAEQELADARAAMERAQTIIPALQAKLKKLQMAHRVAAVRAEIEAANARAEAVELAIRTAYVELSQRIVSEILVPEREAIEALRAAARARADLVAQLAGSDPFEGLTIRDKPFVAAGKGLGRNALPREQLGAEVFLPALDGAGWPMSGAPMWPSDATPAWARASGTTPAGVAA